MQFRLFNKPAAFDIENGKPAGKMWIDGYYDDYVSGEAYEGRVDIHGSVGLMTVKVLGGNIPPGATVTIDQLRKQVVVRWAAWSPPVQEVKEVLNGSFESDAYWEIVGPDTPARIETGWSPNGKGNLTYRDRKGDYTVRGQWAPVSSVNRLITLNGKVEHGKSSKGNASCAMGLSWYDENRNLVREDFGDPITNGGKGRWYDAQVQSASSDRNIKFVRPAIKFGRKKQNHPIHAGQITWDHAYVDGYDEDDILWVEVEVTDSIHNKAVHRGTIDITGTYMISQLYPWSVDQDAVGAALSHVSQAGKSNSLAEEFASELPVIHYVEYKSAINRGILYDEAAAALPVIDSVVYKPTLIRIVAPLEPALAALPTIVSHSYIKTVKHGGAYTETVAAALPTILEVTTQ
ncbi:tail fiber protein [Stenotrophomonas phage BUCT609]|uniref:Tail fiber protein n=1 Tax=Stenotrophomonas phage BUCT609 TaxID=2834250 RepID=A0A8E6URS9_9CAUD|nr:tail fiber protein [Stenotrophomonas phage BUCT609]